jgi:hypothetical protein
VAHGHASGDISTKQIKINTHQPFCSLDGVLRESLVYHSVLNHTYVESGWILEMQMFLCELVGKFSLALAPEGSARTRVIVLASFASILTVLRIT